MTDSSHGAVDAEPQISTPRFAQALLCFSGVIVTIAGGLFGLGISLHALMFLCLIWVGLHAAALGHGYLALREMMSAAIARALPAIYIFILIGMVIASFMQAGTIATLMYYGLAWLSPSLFLSVGLILCALMSIATGTSWGTVGTLGVVFVGLGDALGLPLPLVAGMIVCGATFGDKLSPISDTTNLAAMSAGTDLYRHIYSMLFTTVPTFLLALAIFTALGFGYAAGAPLNTELNILREALASQYALNPLVTLLPLLLLALLSARRVAAEVAMSASVLLATGIAIFFQDSGLVPALNALWQNTPGTTGIENLDGLLGRGGIMSMSWTLLLALLALALGGLLHGAKFLDVTAGRPNLQTAQHRRSAGDYARFGICRQSRHGRGLYLHHPQLSAVQEEVRRRRPGSRSALTHRRRGIYPNHRPYSLDHRWRLLCRNPRRFGTRLPALRLLQLPKRRSVSVDGLLRHRSAARQERNTKIDGRVALLLQAFP